MTMQRAALVNGNLRNVAVPDAVAPGTATLVGKEIPYDYVATFLLEGRAGNRVQDVINISIDGAFVAVAIGYGFIPPQPVQEPRQRAQLESDFKTWGDDELASRLTRGASLLGDLFEVIALPPTSAPERQYVFDPHTLVQHLLLCRCGINFKYSIIDSGTGRELQNQPIHNVAGLGEPHGERPFRPFAKPMLFLPRSTIRIEVQEVSQGPLYTNAELSFVLHGYKILGYGTAIP
jgi:hypothetical protein